MFFFIRKHLRESLLFSSETGRDEGGGAETPEGHQEIFCHHRAGLFTKEAGEAETLKQSQIVYMCFHGAVRTCTGCTIKLN